MSDRMSPREARRAECRNLTDGLRKARAAGRTREANVLRHARHRLERLSLPAANSVPAAAPKATLVVTSQPLPFGQVDHFSSVASSPQLLLGLAVLADGTTAVWAFDGTTWAEVDLGSQGPARLVISGSTPQVVLGQTTLSLAEVTLDPTTGGPVLSAPGPQSAPVSTVLTGVVMNDTTWIYTGAEFLTFDGSTWQVVALPDGPTGPAASATIWRGVAVLGVLDPTSATVKLWTLGSAGWIPGATASLPANLEPTSVALFTLQDLLWVAEWDVTGSITHAGYTADGQTFSPSQVIPIEVPVLSAALPLTTWRSQARCLSVLGGQPTMYSTVIDPLARNVSALVLSANETATLATTGTTLVGPGSDDLTIELWMQATAAGQLARWAGGTASWTLEVGGDAMLVFSLTDGTTPQQCQWGDGLDGPIADLLDGSWHHLAAVRDAHGQALSVYVDGVQVGVQPTPAVLDLGTTTSSLGLGQVDGTLQVAELRIWEAARDVFSIDHAMYHIPPPGIADLIGYWTFEGQAIKNRIDGEPGTISGTLAFAPVGFALVAPGMPEVVVQCKRMQMPPPDDQLDATVFEWHVALEARYATGVGYAPSRGPNLPPGCGFVVWAEREVACFIGDEPSTLGPDQPVTAWSNARGRLNISIPVDQPGPQGGEHHKYSAPLLYVRAEFMLKGALVVSPAREFFVGLSQVKATHLTDPSCGAFPAGTNADHPAVVAAAAVLANLGATVVPHDLEHTGDLGQSGAGTPSRALRFSTRGAPLVNTVDESHAYTGVDLTAVAADPISDVVQVSYVAQQAPGSTGVELLANAAAMPTPAWQIDFTSDTYSKTPPEAQLRALPPDTMNPAPGELAQAIAGAATLSVSAVGTTLVFVVTPVAGVEAAAAPTTYQAGTSRQAMEGANAALKKLGAETDSIWDWLSWIFDIDDMRATTSSVTQILGALRAGLDITINGYESQVRRTIKTAKQKVTAGLQGLLTQLKAGIDPDNTLKLGFGGQQEGNGLPAEAINDALAEQVQQPPSVPSGPPLDPKATAAISALQTALGDTSNPAVQGWNTQVAAAPLSQLFGSPGQIANASLDLLFQALQSVAVAGLDLADWTVGRLFGLLRTLNSSIDALLSIDLGKIPLVGRLLKWLLGDNIPVNPLNLVIFAGSAVATVLGKIFNLTSGPAISAADTQTITAALKRGFGPAASAAEAGPVPAAVVERVTVVMSVIGAVGALAWGIGQTIQDVYAVVGTPPATGLKIATVVSEIVASVLGAFPWAVLAGEEGPADFLGWFIGLTLLVVDLFGLSSSPAVTILAPTCTGLLGLMALGYALGVSLAGVIGGPQDSEGLLRSVLRLVQDVLGTFPSIIQLARNLQNKIANIIIVVIDVVGFGAFVVLQFVRIILDSQQKYIHVWK
jgi:hypothetical protein